MSEENSGILKTMGLINRENNNPDDTIVDKGIFDPDIYLDHVTTNKISYDELVEPIRSNIWEMSSILFDDNYGHLMVVGKERTGKSFLIEQMAYNAEQLAENFKKDRLWFYRVDIEDITSDINISMINFLKVMKNIHHISSKNIVFVTESPNVAYILRKAFPGLKIVFELSDDMLGNLISSQNKNGDKIWSSGFEIFSMDDEKLSKDDLIDSLCKNVLSEQSDSSPIHFTKRHVIKIVNYFINFMQEEIINDNGIMLLPTGLWVSEIWRRFVAKVGFLKREYGKKNETVSETKIVNEAINKTFTSFNENFLLVDKDDDLNSDITIQDLFFGKSQDGDDKSDGSKKAAIKDIDFVDMKTFEKNLKSKIIGQDNIIEKVVEDIAVASVGMTEDNRPLRSFVFLGPTGVGKTELAKQIANSVATTPLPIKRIDMSEYSDSSSVSKFVGSAPGYIGYQEGGQLTEFVKDNPCSVVLLDEVEKAHPDVWDIFLQVLDAGRMTSGKGEEVDFSKTIIILTSNLGMKEASKNYLGFDSHSEEKDYKNRKINFDLSAKKAMKNFFKIEFINRIDRILVFNELSRDSIKKILDLEIERVKEKMSKRNFELKGKTPNSVINKLIKESDVSEFGAREIKRVVYDEIRKPIALEMARNENNRRLKLTLDENGDIKAIKESTRG